MKREGSTPALDIFALRDSVVEEYKAFATSFTTIHADDIREQVSNIYGEERYWPEPLIQINPSYKSSKNIQELVRQGALDPICADIFQVEGRPLTLHRHQQEALALGQKAQSFVVTTGTGSGKSLCFFIPIIDHVLREKRKNPRARTRAIIIYPMNALANSQLEELDKYVGNVPGQAQVTFARYTGQESAERRQAIAANPPDILLTNFMMLELLMTRQDEVDRRVIDNCVGLRFLVLDELHTYRGRQGADVAFLVRRVRERLRPENLQCIGTSATMASEGSNLDKSEAVAQVASKLFSLPIPAGNVVVETLARITNPKVSRESILPKLGQAVDEAIAETISDQELARHPLAIWVETRLGVTFSDLDQRWVRAQPMTVSEAVNALALDSGRDKEKCRTALRNLLLISSIPEQERSTLKDGNSRSFFAFKLHQFISGAGNAYSTLEAPGKRVVTVDGQQFLPTAPEKRLYPLYFCRECGHEYHPVRLVDKDGGLFILPRSIDDAPPGNADDSSKEEQHEERFGFVSLDPRTDSNFNFKGYDEDYPETWLEYDAQGMARLKYTYRKWRVSKYEVAPDGQVGRGEQTWFIPERFRFCLRCGHTHSSSARDRTRLASLSAEGRSSATTVLVASALRWMHGMDSGLKDFSRKLLGFTDNRQDAALQAGHFNDFLFVSLVRAGFLSALRAAGNRGLRSHELGEAQQKALGFNSSEVEIRSEWLQEPTLKGFNLIEAENTLRQVLAYRIWFDQRRGWRYTNPSLEQLGLLRVEYQGIEDLAADEEEFSEAHPLLRQASPKVRANLYQELLDHLRRGMAIKTQELEASALQQLAGQSHSRLRSPWGLARNESPQGARWMMLSPRSNRKGSYRDQELVVSGSSRSALGKALRAGKLWDGAEGIQSLKQKDFDALIENLLQAARSHGLVSLENSPFDEPGWQLNGAAVVFKLGEPKSSAKRFSSSENAFFCDLYEKLSELLGAHIHPLFGFEAREHTAQVDSERRAVREQRFRYGAKERKELEEKEQALREMDESNRFLPVLFCSPTMELGVDISALNVVYMRNVPPTPANYAQRSGRAGRSGQAALVLSYASAHSPHDQYFFREPSAMVHGEVKVPLLDLANRDLVDSHLLAVWLSCVEQALPSNIAELLDLREPERPLLGTFMAAMSERQIGRIAEERIRAVLDLVADELRPELAPWYTGSEAYAKAIASTALERFCKAFERWRNLFAAAEEQRDAARRTMDAFHTAPMHERNAAKVRHDQALQQLDLLQRGSHSLSSDFYTYRYLATEGFLPGYNFPRLPLMAYIPSTKRTRGRQIYLQRPRFLALSEFGPRSLVYHEGRAYRVVRALLSSGQRDAATPDVLLPTRSVRICSHCGGGHFNSQVSICHACGASLGSADIVNRIYRIENVATQPTERITANDEERQRQGFELQTTFEWAVREGKPDVRSGLASDDEGCIAQLHYGPGATITRLNKGLRRRRNKTEFGFRIDPVSGYWAKNDDEEGEQDPNSSPRQWIVPCVQDRKNALLFMPEDRLPETSIATLQHALLRGLEAVFQLEEGEILAEAIPSNDERRGFLCYEATEGGAGVLNRLVAEASSLAAVARQALSVMHFEIGDDDAPLPKAPSELKDLAQDACVAACYRCLMSYYNQPDHELIDRRDTKVKELLLRIAALDGGQVRSQTSTPGEGRGPVFSEQQDESQNGEDWSQAELDSEWKAMAQTRQIPPADAKALELGPHSVLLVWREHYLAALFDDSPSELAEELENRGFMVIHFGERATWDAGFKNLARALGIHA